MQNNEPHTLILHSDCFCSFSSEKGNCTPGMAMQLFRKKGGKESKLEKKTRREKLHLSKNASVLWCALMFASRMVSAEMCSAVSVVADRYRKQILGKRKTNTKYKPVRLDGNNQSLAKHKKICSRRVQVLQL